ncbi:MAG TPA: DegV family protein, partial [Anaerolineaceae bacterium]|nr:DegV family protein [Anaerolineaceae bacterium]
AVQAKDLLPGVAYEVVDSRSASMAMGFSVLAVARAAQAGASLAECKAIAENARQQIGVIFVVDTLKYLHLGGRIGGATRFLGTALDLKPLLELVDGRIEAVERVRTKRKAIDRLLDLAEQRIDGRKPVRLAALHANAEEEADHLVERAGARFNAVEILCEELSPVVGVHAGPGTIGLAYMVGM